MNVPIVCLIASYKEGPLIQGAIRSALKATPHVLVFDGPTEGVQIEDAEDTDCGSYQKYLKYVGEFDTETSKRNLMLQYARQITVKHKPFWILTLDADEILVWPEYLQDWLNMLQPGYPQSGENIAALKRTEATHRPDITRPLTVDGETFDIVTKSGNGMWTDIVPSRCIHSSIIKRYDVGCWRIETPDGVFGGLDNAQSPLPPMYGEPHIHHRAYMRRPERRVLRLHMGEEKRWKEANVFGQNLAEIENPNA
jgi:hypothetical protein